MGEEGMCPHPNNLSVNLWFSLLISALSVCAAEFGGEFAALLKTLASYLYFCGHVT